MSRQITFAKAIREALEEEMRADEAVFLLGQDIRYSMYGITGGMHEEFGTDRVLPAPIAENGFCSAAIGAALVGRKPVVEVMYDDFVLLAMDALGNEAAKWKYFTNVSVPVVYRMAGTGTGSGGGPHHSQSLEAVPMHFPGLKVIFPSTPEDVKGLLKSAVRDPNPVIIFEGKKLYQTKGDVPEGEYTIPIGKAKVIREGTDITIVTYGVGCMKALSAAEKLAAEGINVEVVDLRTLLPYDKESVLKSIEKTGKLIMLEHDTKTMGVGAEIVAMVAEEGLAYLSAPVKRLAMADTCVPGHRETEEYVNPSEEDVMNAARELSAI
jgi:pyruvate/2-oxoglutarate/acetoin dehydrogenase E1 component